MGSSSKGRKLWARSASQMRQKILSINSTTVTGRFGCSANGTKILAVIVQLPPTRIDSDCRLGFVMFGSQLLPPPQLAQHNIRRHDLSFCASHLLQRRARARYVRCLLIKQENHPIAMIAGKLPIKKIRVLLGLALLVGWLWLGNQTGHVQQ